MARLSRATGPGRVGSCRSEALAQIDRVSPRLRGRSDDLRCEGSLGGAPPALHPGGKAWTVVLEREQCWCLLDLRIFGAGRRRIVHAAQMTNQAVARWATEEDLDELVGHVAAGTNGKPNRRRRGLHELADLLAPAPLASSSAREQ